MPGSGKKARFRWDRPERLVVYAEQAKNIPPKDSSGSSSTYLIAKPNGLRGDSQKTDIHKKNLNPPYRTFFIFTTPLPNFIDFEILHKGSLGDKLCARARFPVSVNELLKFNERTSTVVLPMNSDERDTRVETELRLHLAFSTQPELRELVEKDPIDIFYYRPWMSKVKAGDLILFNGSGPVEAMTKILTSSPYTGVGMVLELPNKWTKKKELYLIELSSNKDLMLDAYREDKVAGCSIFRLWERIHQYHGLALWWLPLRSPLSSRAQERLSSNISTAHARISVGFTSLPYTRWEARFLRSFGLFALENGQIDTYQAEFCARLLKVAGVWRSGEERPPGEYLKPSHLTTLSCFSRPVLFRVNSEYSKCFAPSKVPSEKSIKHQLSVRPSEAKYQAERRRLTEGPNNPNPNPNPNGKEKSSNPPERREKSSNPPTGVAERREKSSAELAQVVGNERPSVEAKRSAHAGRERKQGETRAKTDRSRTIDRSDFPLVSSKSVQPLSSKERKERRKTMGPEDLRMEEAEQSESDEDSPHLNKTFDFNLDDLDDIQLSEEGEATPLQFLDAEKSLRMYNKSSALPLRSLDEVDSDDLDDVLNVLHGFHQ